MCDKNLANSAIKVFSIYKKLLSENISKADLIAGFSEDSLLLYLNTLKALGVSISYPSRASSFYSMKNNLDFLNLSSKDITLFSDLKKILSENSTYADIIEFNNFISGLKRYVSDDCAEKLAKIISQKPFGLSMHALLLELESFIENKQPILVGYDSPSSTMNYFKILPKILKLQKSKAYLWAVDSSLDELRCIRVDRINSIAKIDEVILDKEEKYAICRFSPGIKDFLISDENMEILSETNDSIVARYYFYNDFSAIQKILSYGLFCEILEPSYLRTQIQEKILNIRMLYGE